MGKVNDGNAKATWAQNWQDSQTSFSVHYQLCTFLIKPPPPPPKKVILGRKDVTILSPSEEKKKNSTLLPPTKKPVFSDSKDNQHPPPRTLFSPTAKPISGGGWRAMTLCAKMKPLSHTYRWALPHTSNREAAGGELGLVGRRLKWGLPQTIVWPATATLLTTFFIWGFDLKYRSHQRSEKILPPGFEGWLQTRNLLMQTRARACVCVCLYFFLHPSRQVRQVIYLALYCLVGWVSPIKWWETSFSTERAERQTDTP